MVEAYVSTEDLGLDVKAGTTSASYEKLDGLAPDVQACLNEGRGDGSVLPDNEVGAVLEDS